MRHCELRVWESKKSLDPWEDRVRGLKSFWVGLDVKIKRDFMKVSIAKLRSFVKRVHKTKGLDALETFSLLLGNTVNGCSGCVDVEL